MRRYLEISGGPRRTFAAALVVAALVGGSLGVGGVAASASSSAAKVVSSSGAGTVATSPSPSIVHYNVTDISASTFATPPQADKPWVRWDIVPELTAAEITNELNEMNAAGIGGAEVGQGAFPTPDQMTAMLTTANALGMGISWAHGPTEYGPSTGPNAYVSAFSINDNNSRESLVYGKTVVAAGATYTGVVPSPGTSSTTTTLLAVLAYQCVTSPCPASGTVNMIQSTEVDLTATVTGTNTSGRNGGSTAGNISWTAPTSPAGASYELISVWTRGVQAQPDLLSAAGLAIEENAMATYFAPVASLMQTNASLGLGSNFFYDSHSSDRGDPTDLWTNDMRAQFQAHTGYDIFPYLPALSTSFAFSDGSAPRVVDDMSQTRLSLWINNQILPFQAWAHSTYGWQMKLEPYGDNSPAGVDEEAAAQVLDMPETETLFLRDDADAYRNMSSANHITGNPWFSIEGAATLNQAYGQDWQDLLVKLNAFFSGGGTKEIFHLWATAYSNTSLWPGYGYFGQGFSNAWSPEEPYWLDAATNNGYIARNQQVLTQGQAKVDVAIYDQSYETIGAGATISPSLWTDLTLEKAGYTHDYLNNSILAVPSVTVSNGVLDASGPAYKAFIVDSTLQGPTNPIKTAMPVTIAQEILGFAQAGLPIVVVGTPPNVTLGNTPGADATLQATITQLLAQPTVHQVANEAAVPALLTSLGITPDTLPTAPINLESVHRSVPGTDYYFLYNQTTPKYSSADNVIYDQPLTGATIDTQLSLVGTGQPYMLDAWTGKVTPITQYQAAGGHVIVHLVLAPEQTTIIALTAGSRFTAPAVGAHATNLSGSFVYAQDGNVALQATANGTQAVTLSNGQTVNVTASNVPSAIDLSSASWNLAVQSWTPANPYLTTFGQTATQTAITPINLTLPSLLPWPSIPALANVSGTGVYSTSFNLPAGWRSDQGAYLSLGTIFDSFTVTVNGQALPAVNAASRTVDVGQYLVAGSNTIAIRVTTTLRNVLRTLDSTQLSRPAQPYGLTGPVTLQPYEQVEIGSLSGSFTAGGTPQVGGTVYAFDAATETYVDSAVADGSGNYAFSNNLAPGSYKLLVAPVSPGLSTQWFGGADFASATTVAVTSNTTQNVALNGAYTLSGTFTAGGVAQAGGTVYAFTAGVYSYVGSAAVDGSGNYNFGYLPAGNYKLFVAPSSPGYGMQWFGGIDFLTAATVAVTANTTQNIALPGVYDLSGNFTAGGVPQAGGTVYAFTAGSYSYVGSAAVDGSGHYDFGFLPTGSYKLFLAPSSAGYGMQWFGGSDFASATTVALTAATVQNISLIGEYTLSGNFTAGGSPQTGGALYVFTAAGSYAGSAAVDGSGHYSFGYLAAGSYKIYLAPISAGYYLQWFGGATFASAPTFNLSANSILNIAL